MCKCNAPAPGTVAEIQGPLRIMSAAGTPLFELGETPGGGVLRVFDRQGRIAAEVGCNSFNPGQRQIALFRPGAELPTVSIEESGLDAVLTIGAGRVEGPEVMVVADADTARIIRLDCSGAEIPASG